MEAFGSGLYMVGYNVNYGNPTFCRRNENGYLVPYWVGNRKDNILSLASGIGEYLSSKEDMSRTSSYEIAEHYLKDNVKESWRSLLNDKSV